MIEFLTLGGILGGLGLWAFWGVALIAFFVSAALAEGEHWGWATTLFAGVFVGLGLLGSFNLYNFTLDHPWQLVKWIAIYLGGGVIWGTVKWYIYCTKQRKKYEAAKADFLQARGVTEFTPILKVEWTEKLKNADHYTRSYGISLQAPQAKQNKEKIMNWMYLWPFSIFGTFFADFILEVWNWLYKWMGGIYDNISKAVWRGVSDDLASETEIEAARQAVKQKTSSANSSQQY